MKSKQILISFIVGIFLFGAISVDADDVNSKDEILTSSSSESSDSTSKVEDELHKKITDQATANIINGHLVRREEFDTKTDYILYTEIYANLKVEYKKGEKKGRTDGYKHQTHDVNNKSEVFQAGYQEGLRLGNEIYELKHESHDNSSSATRSVESEMKQTTPSHDVHKDIHAPISYAEQTNEINPPNSVDESSLLNTLLQLPELPALPLGPIIESHQAFIDLIALDAVKIARKNDLYPSVMIAQAALESSWGTSDLSRPDIYNLFGVKGGYKGSSIQMKTQEDNGSGELQYVNADFRQYHSFSESLQDYATVLNQPMFMMVKRSVCANYQEVTLKLTGTYATDTQYNLKLNQIIETYHLTKFDKKTGVKPLTAIVIPKSAFVFEQSNKHVQTRRQHKDSIKINVMGQCVMVIITILIVLKKPTVKK